MISTEPVTQISLCTALRRLELFSDLTDDELEWFVDHAEDQCFAEGAQLVHEGDEADSMTIMLEGQLRFQSAEIGAPVMIARKGMATGLLPFSRLKRYTGNAFAITPLRVARVHRDNFDSMLKRIPRLAPRLVGVLLDRVRESTRVLEQREKLKALGKLAAGLAHELNNPASAAHSSAEDLRRWFTLLRDSNQELAAVGFTVTQFQCLMEFERDMIRSSARYVDIDSIERSDREEALSAWLRERSQQRGWEFAPVFIDAGVGKEKLSEVIECFSESAREAAIARLAASLAIERLTKGIQASTNQISELVQAVKGYSFVDQVPNQEVDIVGGIEDTLSMFNYRLRRGIDVVRRYDETVPRINANGPELNLVWTHLIDNALDAMNGVPNPKGTLGVRTGCEAGMALVEIADTGPGIPPEIRERVFDPFFTTKDVGSGRGLGLDLVYRIVQKHSGDIRFTSKPGETVFQVRLPLQNIGAF